jgi:alpha-tubulin suppressor-like RCC1 family protein
VGSGVLGHGDTQYQPSPKRVTALLAVPVSSVSAEDYHALALAEDGLVYAWGENDDKALLGIPRARTRLRPKPIEALRGVRVSNVVATSLRSYALADTGELWVWGKDGINYPPLGHGGQRACPLPKPIESSRGAKVDAFDANNVHTLALADYGSVYAWGHRAAAQSGALGLGPSVTEVGMEGVPMPQVLRALLEAYVRS